MRIPFSHSQRSSTKLDVSSHKSCPFPFYHFLPPSLFFFCCTSISQLPFNFLEVHICSYINCIMYRQLFSVAALAATAFAQNATNSTGEGTPSLTDLLSSTESLSSLRTAVESVPGLGEMLGSAMNVTVLAPSNEAFEMFMSSARGQSFNDEDAIQVSFSTNNRLRSLTRRNQSGPAELPYNQWYIPFRRCLRDACLPADNVKQHRIRERDRQAPLPRNTLLIMSLTITRRTSRPGSDAGRECRLLLGATQQRDCY